MRAVEGAKSNLNQCAVYDDRFYANAQRKVRGKDPTCGCCDTNGVDFFPSLGTFEDATFVSRLQRFSLV